LWESDDDAKTDLASSLIFRASAGVYVSDEAGRVMTTLKGLIGLGCKSANPPQAVAESIDKWIGAKSLLE
jgi:hypothetical protein